MSTRRTAERGKKALFLSDFIRRKAKRVKKR